MYKWHCDYPDFDGNLRSEDFYFNLTKAEVIEWLTTNGDYTLDKVLLRLGQERNAKEIMSLFKDLIYRSYGVKSLDGRRFVKSEEVKQDFMETEAFSILFTELVTDATKAANFINQIIPADLSEEALKIMKENPEGIPDELKDYLPKIPS